MMRRGGLARAGRLAALLLLAGCAGDMADRGSLVLVTLDTTRADRLEPYGARAAETPALAGLAAAGTLFESAYAVTPVTLPSHASIFSGLDPIRHGVHDNGVAVPAERFPVLAEILAAAGMRTGAFVSAAVLDGRFGLERGFEVYDDDLAGGGPRAARLIAERPAAATIDAALAWLEGLEPDERFFLWVHLFDPHAAYQPPPPFAERFRERPYDGEIAAMDHELGRLLAHPRAAAGPNVVMAVADHGESLGEHGEETHAMLAYDATLRIPWIVRGPGIEGGRRVTGPVSQVDLLPTALALLGLPPPAGLAVDGTDLSPTLRGAAQPPSDRLLYGETEVPRLTYGWAPQWVVRRGRWKLVQAGEKSELYDLETDPGELRDLAGDEPRRVAELRRALAELRSRRPAPAAPALADRRTGEMLRSLGYLSGAGSPARSGAAPDPAAMIGTHLEFERAADLFHRRELDRAIPLLGDVLASDAGNLAASMMLARALSQRLRHEEALSLAERAVALAPSDADARLTQGVVLARQGRLVAALEAIEAALALRPDLLDARLERALLLFRLDRPEEAESGLRALLERDPTNPRAVIAMAERVELAGGRTAEAETRLVEVLARDPSRVEGWRALGRLLDRTGRPEKAIEALRRGLREVPGDGLSHAHLGMILGRLGRIDEAEASLLRARELLRPGSATVHNALAGLNLRRGRWAAAEREARRAVELDPTLAAAWSNLGAALEELGDPPAALDAYDRALEADPTHWQAEFNRALLLRLGGRYEEAAAGYRAVLRRNPGHAKSHFELGLLLLGPLGDRAAGERHLEAAIAAAPGEPLAAEARRLLDG